MCKFCESSERTEFIIPVRNNSSCDNVCEIMTSKIEKYGEELFLTGTDCSDCDGCKEENRTFEIYKSKNRIGLSYIQNIKGLRVMPYSEMLNLNFCPWCGKQISNELIEFERCCIGKIKIKE